MKKAFCLFLAVLTALTLTAEERKKVAVVLSGGGAKGLAHVGALKVIEKAGIPVDIVVGTSMGSLVGGLYAIGYNAHQLDSIARSLDWMDIITDRDDIRSLNIIERERQNTYLLQRELTKDNKGGLLKGRKVITTLERLCAGYTDSIDFDKLPIRYSCIATDLADKTEIDIHSGSLPLAMRASMAIPAVFTPVRQDGKVLVDGGFTNDYPVDVARKMGADIVIGVTVVQSPQKAEQLKSTSNVIMQVLFFNILNKFEENIANTDLYIPVNTTGYTAGSFGKTAVDSLIQRGEQQAMSQWDEMLKLKEQIGISSTTVLGDLQSPHCFRGFAIPAPLTVLGDLQSPHPSSLTPPSEGRGASRRLSLALRADNEELVAMQVNASIPLGASEVSSPFRGPGGCLEGAIRLGKRIKAGADLTLHPCTSWPFLATALSYHFHHNDINLYHKGKREYNILYNRHETQLQPLSIQLHDLIFSAGLRWDYYNFVNELQRVGTSVSALESSPPFRGPGGRLEGASSLTPPFRGPGGRRGATTSLGRPACITTQKTTGTSPQEAHA